MINKRNMLVPVVAMSFLYGAAFAQYHIFPFNQLSILKDMVAPSKPLPAFSAHYLHRKSFFEHFSSKVDIVFLGDSLTNDAEWAQMLPNISLANHGISGDSTTGGINRLKATIDTKPSKVFVMFGINDFRYGASVDSVFNNYQIIVHELLKNNISVYIQSTLIGGEQRVKRNIKVRELNKRLQSFSTENESTTYINLNERMSVDGVLNPLFTSDGTHLNAKGYQQWKDVIYAYL